MISLSKKFLVATTLSFSMSTSYAWAQSYSVPGLTLTKTSTSISAVSFKGSAQCSTISGFELTTPHRFVVDCFYPVGGTKKSQNKQFGLSSSGLVTSIRYGSHQDKIRLVFDLSESASKVSFSKGDAKSFIVNVKGDNSHDGAPQAPKKVVKEKVPPKPKKPASSADTEIAREPAPSVPPILPPEPQQTPPPQVPPAKTGAEELPWVPSGNEFITSPTATPVVAPTQQQEQPPVLPTTTIATPQPTLPPATPVPATPAPTKAIDPKDIQVGIPKGEVPIEIPKSDIAENDSLQADLIGQGYKIIPENIHGNRKLGNVVFDYLPPLSLPVVRLVFSSVPEYRMSKKGEHEYVITVPDCSLSGPSTALPFFPPEDFNGFLLVQASDDGRNCKIRVGTDRGSRIAPYIKEREIQIRISVN